MCGRCVLLVLVDRIRYALLLCVLICRCLSLSVSFVFIVDYLFIVVCCHALALSVEGFRLVGGWCVPF